MKVVEQDRPVNGITVHHAVAGEGPALVLLHGFPHTWRVWSRVVPALARTHRVIAPDLRGLGGSTRAVEGYDAGTLADDLVGLLDAFGIGAADVVGIDAGVPPAFLAAVRHPERVRRLVVMESLVGTLVGAEEFLAGGPPWWFGFHAVPGLAETVLVGHEREYVEWFLRAGTHEGRGVPDDVRDAFVAAYSGPDSLRCAFEHYRAMTTNARLVREAVADARLTVPTLAVGARPVGDTLARQLAPYTDHLESHVIPYCGHLIPLDRPAELLALLGPFLAGPVAVAAAPAG